jgi:hypothetical protein
MLGGPLATVLPLPLVSEPPARACFFEAEFPFMFAVHRLGLLGRLTRDGGSDTRLFGSPGIERNSFGSGCDGVRLQRWVLAPGPGTAECQCFRDIASLGFRGRQIDLGQRDGVRGFGWQMRVTATS